MPNTDATTLHAPVDSQRDTSGAGKPSHLSRQRTSAWRLLDTVGGVALGALLVFALQAWRAAPISPATANAGAHASQAGPWAGCSLLSQDEADVTDGETTVSHQVTQVWVCAHAIPPAYVTPSVGVTPTAR